MFGFFKKKERSPSIRYKILPYQESGFIVEMHTGKNLVCVYGKFVSRFSILTPDENEIDAFNHIDYCKPKIFSAKEDAREFIDNIIAEENKRKAARNDRIRREEEHAKNNPPEWYP